MLNALGAVLGLAREPENKDAIRAAGGIPHLVRLIDPDSAPACAELAALALAELARL